MGKIFAEILLIFFIIILQTGFLPSIGWSISQTDLILVAIIFITIIISIEKVYLWIVVGGVLIGLYTLHNPILTIVPMLITIYLINSIFKHFFTNRSLYSLLFLGAIGTLLYNILTTFLIHLAWYLKISEFRIWINRFFFENLIRQIIANEILLIILFVVLNFLSNRLKSYFLIRD